MSISYPINMPDNGEGFIRRTQFRLKHAQAITASPYSLKAQRHDYLGDALEVDITLRPMLREDGARWAAFLAALRGTVGSFRFKNRDQPQPIGAARNNTGKLSGSAAAGSDSISTNNWPANTKVLEAGDWLQLSNRLYMAVEPVISSSGGAATFDIAPRIRATVGGGTKLFFRYPYGLFRLANPEAKWTTDDFVHTSATIVAVEDI